MTIPTEQCAYAKLGMQENTCGDIGCRGYSESCFQYTTLGHVGRFQKLFERTPEHPRVQEFYRRYGRDWKGKLEGSVK